MSDFTWIQWPTRNTLAQKEKTWKRHHITAKSWAEGYAEKKQSLFFNVLTNKKSLCVFFPVLKQFNLFCTEWWEEIRVPCLVSCHDRREPVVTILQILVFFYLPAALLVVCLHCNELAESEEILIHITKSKTPSMTL